MYYRSRNKKKNQSKNKKSFLDNEKNIMWRIILYAINNEHNERSIEM